MVNYALIRFLRIPPIIATLSSSFVFQSAAIWYNRGLRIKPPPVLADFTTMMVGGVPILALVVLVASALLHLVLTRTIYGRSVIAIGQNARAARLAGVPVERTRFLTYVMCAVLAALCGYLVAGFSGGAALNMGQEYLLSSIAVVVIGGTSVSGGFANVPGLWGAAHVPLSPRHHAQHLGLRRRHALGPDRPRHHRGHCRRQRPETARLTSGGSALRDGSRLISLTRS